MNYEHRMMRCKLDRSARIGTRRYRPGEMLQDDHKPTDDFEEFTPPKVEVPIPAPIPVRLAPVKPKSDEKVHGLPPLPKIEDDIDGD